MAASEQCDSCLLENSMLCITVFLASATNHLLCILSDIPASLLLTWMVSTPTRCKTSKRGQD